MLGINEIYINLMFRLVSHPVASHCVCVNLKSKIKKEKKKSATYLVPDCSSKQQV